MGCNRVLCISALFVIFHVFCSCRAFDTITRTHFIADNEKGSLVSSDGNFKLGFFSPGKSQARYVGIWFNKITQQTVVWVANRASPVKDSSGVFKIGGDGNLAVFCCNQSSPVWSTNVSVPAGTSTAKLLDSGNLVLVAEETIWQSFDYPTDTVLPYMKFGWNKKTGLNHMMTSWKSIDDPSPGEFSAGFDPHSIPQFFVYRNSVPLRRSGPWNSRVDTKDYDSYQLYIHNITFVSNEEEAYVTCPPKEGTVLSIVVLETTGVLKRLLWHESQRWVKVDVLFQDLCDEYMRCGLNAICNADTLAHCSCLPGFEQLYLQDRYLKCQETGKEGCGKGDGEGFVRLEGVKLPDARNSKFHSNISLEDCERECLKCCNCTGYANQYVVGMGQGCITWHGELRDMSRYKSGQDFYLRVDAAELAADAKKNAKHFVTKNMLVFMIVPIVIEMMLAALFFYYWWWKKNEKRKGQKQKRLRENSLILESARSLSNQKDSISSSGNDKNIELVLFELSTIAAATNHFSSTNKLGRGGFGTVYKGQLPNGQEIAVKRLAKDSGQGILEFKNEVLLIGKLQHRNLVRLLGYCIEKDEKMLIYEFMLNKSLDHFIFDESRKPLLDWTTRFEIILGIARGILYLHQDSRLRIIHRDLKVSNILLDKDMEPKISDFGIARTFGQDQDQRNTKRVVGTYGYMSPEYALDGLYSIKSDVFSFGVILLEIISGKKNRGYFHTDPYSNLIQYTWELWRDGFALKIVDSSIADSSPLNELQRCIQVGLLCVQDNARDRPSMSTVVFMLSNETILPSPQKSTFAIRNKGSGSSIIEREYSINEVTITTFNAR